MEVEHHDRHDGAQLDDHVEHLHKGITQVWLQDIPHKDQVAGAADRKPLGDTLHDSQDYDFDNI